MRMSVLAGHSLHARPAGPAAPRARLVANPSI